MKNRLIKMNVDGWKHYYLKNEEGRTIASTNYPFPPESLLLANHYGITLQKLSRDNCEAIELGYDLNEFAEEWIDSNGEKWSNNNNEVGDNYGSFKAGFQKAVETLANNKFTAEDMSTMLLNTTDWMNEQSPDWDANKLLTETIKSLIPTISISLRLRWYIALVTKRPILPKPFIATRIAIIQPLNKKIYESFYKNTNFISIFILLQII